MRCIRPIRAYLLTAALVALAACTPELPPPGRAQLDELRAGYAAGRYAETVAGAERFLDRYGRTDAAAEVRYLRGAARAKLDDAGPAAEDLAAAVRALEDPALRLKAALELARVQQRGGDVAAAEETLREAVEPIREETPSSGEARLLLAKLLQRRGAWRAADLQLERIAHGLGGTDLAERAGRRSRARAWTLEYAAHGDADAARALRDRLSAEEVAARVEPVLRDGRLVFVVRAGSFATRADAEAARRALPGDGGAPRVALSRCAGE